MRIVFFILFSFLFFICQGLQNISIDRVDSLLKCLGETEELEKQQLINLKLASLINNGHQSLKYAKRSLQLSIENNDKENIAKSYIEIANDYERINDFAKASEAIFNASRIYEEIGDNGGYGITLNMLGQLCFSHQEFSKAINHFNKAIVFHSHLKDSIPLANDYNNLGEVYRVKGVFDSALYYFSKAQFIYQSKQSKIGIAYSLGNIALVDIALGKGNEALERLNEATFMLENLHDFYPISIFNIEMAKTSLEKGQLKMALTLANKGYNIAKSEGLIEQVRDASMVLYQIYLKKKANAPAIKYLQEYYATKDSIINEQNIQKIADLQTEYQLSRKEDQLNKMSVQNQRTITIVIYLLVALILILLLSFYLFMFNKKLKTANLTLEYQRQQMEGQKTIIGDALTEKETLLKEIHHRVKNNLQIISSLLNLQSSTLEDKELIEVFQKGQSRIQSIALIHQRLYQNEDLTVINMQEYIEQLGNKIIDTLLSPEKKVLVKVNAREILLDIDTAVPLGLIINELLTNSIKYAFLNTSEGTIQIHITKLEIHSYQIHYSDSGSGLPKGTRLECYQTLGSKLITILTRQLGGQVDYYNENGAHFIIKFYDMVKRKELA